MLSLRYKRLQKLLIAFTLIFLWGCTSNNLQTLNLRTSQHINESVTNTQDYGYLIAFYDLIESDTQHTNYLFNKRYASLVNDDAYLAQYADSIKDKVFDRKKIEVLAKAKIQLLTDSLSVLRNKFGVIPTPPLFLRIRMHFNIGTSLDHLKVLDQYYSNLPILAPQELAKINSKFGNRCMYHSVNIPVTSKIKVQSNTKKASQKKGKSKSSNAAYKTITTMQKSKQRICKTHRGIDLKSQRLDIYASGGGVVASTKRDSGFGNNIVIDHGRGIKTRYAHLNQLFVKEGEHVIRGQKIGTQGASGRATGPHLHFEIIVKGVRINPEEFIKFSSICSGG